MKTHKAETLHLITEAELDTVISAALDLEVEFKAQKRLGTNITPSIIGRNIAVESLRALAAGKEWDLYLDVNHEMHERRMMRYTFTKQENLTPLAALKICDAVETACSMSPTWFGSRACDFVQELRGQLRILVLASDPEYAQKAEYLAAPWGRVQ